MRRLEHWLTLARLGAQLGPFEHPALTRTPLARPVRRSSVAVDGRFPLLLFRPVGKPTGALFVAPGLHYAGPAEPRMSGFFESLARAGLLVGVPALPGFRQLNLGLGMIEDFQTAFEVFQPLSAREGLPKPGVFSISFGSLPALRLASAPGFADAVSGLVTFGGFADWRTALRFSLTGRHPDAGDAAAAGAPAPHDPLNKPVIFMNLLDAMPTDLVAVQDREVLHAAWFQYVRATWGREEMKPETAHRPVAESVAQQLAPRLQHPFMMGCGLAPGAMAVALDALERKRADFLDPRPHMSGLRAPLHIIHGVADDVIPYTEAGKLADAAAPVARARVHLTGLYGHSRSASPVGARAAVQEGLSMAAMLVAIGRVASGRP